LLTSVVPVGDWLVRRWIKGTQACCQERQDTDERDDPAQVRLMPHPELFKFKIGGLEWLPMRLFRQERRPDNARVDQQTEKSFFNQHGSFPIPKDEDHDG
jgi:hypothetical protein